MRDDDIIENDVETWDVCHVSVYFGPTKDRNVNEKVTCVTHLSGPHVRSHVSPRGPPLKYGWWGPDGFSERVAPIVS
jgi:hypothetical protein